MEEVGGYIDIFSRPINSTWEISWSVWR